ncbi:MAG TPA: putative peptidoglycan glycosyltransferase FtsW [Gemmatimonadales bacterium]|nr:putative peptidoglycan glycosyltransferase FtsW [Gemmatimonadales bacterium]
MTTPSLLRSHELRWETRLLAVVTAVLTVFGIASLYAAATLERDAWSFFTKQLSGAVGGTILMVIFSRVDYHRWRQYAWPLLLATVVLLIIPLLPFTRPISPMRNGARRWIVLGPLTVQPSEVARFAIAVWTAMLAAKKGELVRGFKKGVAPFLLVLGAVSLLILLEPNLSMAVLVTLIGGVVLFTAGAKIGHFLLLGVAGVFAAISLIWAEPYRLTRLRCFLEPCGEGGFQLSQALLGFGAGGPFGVGFGHGQLKLHYLPYAYSDFLFSTIGEEWGFLGVLVIVSLFGLFCWLGFRIARTAPDAFGQYLATGLTATVALAALLHMCVTLGLMPTTGLAFPFMSYGRSGLVMALISVGVLINIGRQRGKPRVRGEKAVRGKQ